MEITAIQGTGLEVPVENHTRLRVSHGGTDFWYVAHQDILVDKLSPFLAKIRYNDANNSIIASLYENGVEQLCNSRALRDCYEELEPSVYDAFEQRVKQFRAAIDAPNIDQNTKLLFEKFAIPNPQFEPEMYRVYGSRTEPKLAIIWGMERIIDSSLNLSRLDLASFFKRKPEPGGCGKSFAKGSIFMLLLAAGSGAVYLATRDGDKPLTEELATVIDSVGKAGEASIVDNKSSIVEGEASIVDNKPSIVEGGPSIVEDDDEASIVEDVQPTIIPSGMTLEDYDAQRQREWDALDSQCKELEKLLNEFDVSSPGPSVIDTPPTSQDVEKAAAEGNVPLMNQQIQQLENPPPGLDAALLAQYAQLAEKARARVRAIREQEAQEHEDMKAQWQVLVDSGTQPQDDALFAARVDGYRNRLEINMKAAQEALDEARAKLHAQRLKEISQWGVAPAAPIETVPSSTDIQKAHAQKDKAMLTRYRDMLLGIRGSERTSYDKMMAVKEKLQDKINELEETVGDDPEKQGKLQQLKDNLDLIAQALKKQYANFRGVESLAADADSKLNDLNRPVVDEQSRQSHVQLVERYLALSAARGSYSEQEYQQFLQQRDNHLANLKQKQQTLPASDRGIYDAMIAEVSQMELPEPEIKIPSEEQIQQAYEQGDLPQLQKYEKIISQIFEKEKKKSQAAENRLNQLGKMIEEKEQTVGDNPEAQSELAKLKETFEKLKKLFDRQQSYISHVGTLHANTQDQVKSLTESKPEPKPKPVPTPVEPKREPTPVIPTPEPEPEPEPVIPTPEPEPEPEPVIPTPEPEPEPEPEPALSEDEQRAHAQLKDQYEEEKASGALQDGSADLYERVQEYSNDLKEKLRIAREQQDAARIAALNALISELFLWDVPKPAPLPSIIIGNVEDGYQVEARVQKKNQNGTYDVELQLIPSQGVLIKHAKMNQIPGQLSESGSYDAVVSLPAGRNIVTIKVQIDGENDERSKPIEINLK